MALSPVGELLAKTHNPFGIDALVTKFDSISKIRLSHGETRKANATWLDRSQRSE